MKLTKQQRSELFAGRTPKITLPGDKPCPVQSGYVHALSANVKIVVVGVNKDRHGDHSLVYALHDARERYLARQDGRTHPEQYASSNVGGIDHEAGRAIDAATQEEYSKEGRARDRLRQEAKHEARKALSRSQRLALVEQEAKQRRVPISTQLGAIERQLERIESRLDNVA